MGCFHPIPAWRTPAGEIHIAKQQPDSIHLRLPCGGCLGCRMAAAQAWTLRCQLELQRHDTAIFTTLTYDDENVPITLPQPKTALPLWLKRLRKNTGKKLRFFACAEYGERTKRPHFHAILYGLSMADAGMVESTWGRGHTRTEPITPARIAYTAGYCQKKIGYKRHQHEKVDPQTGEVYTWQPPYKLMSRRPGIGANAKKWAQSWRLFAIKDGHKMPVPRFLHEAWKQQATIIEQEELAFEKSTLNRYTTEKQRQAQEQIAIAQQRLSAEKRQL